MSTLQLNLLTQYVGGYHIMDGCKRSTSFTSRSMNKGERHPNEIAVITQIGPTCCSRWSGSLVSSFDRGVESRGEGSNPGSATVEEEEDGRSQGSGQPLHKLHSFAHMKQVSKDRVEKGTSGRSTTIPVCAKAVRVRRSYTCAVAGRPSGI